VVDEDVEITGIGKEYGRKEGWKQRYERDRGKDEKW
jgi:hypothetical protein